MTITLLTSASGSPGVTTTAVGLTVSWPDSCLLVDADYQMAILSGYLEGSHVSPNGLLHVINASRLTENAREAVWRQSIPLPEDDPDGRRRLLLPGLPSPQTSGALTASWTPIAAGLRDLDTAGVDVVVDLGRLTPAGIHPALLEVATHVRLMTRPTLRAVGACHWAARLLADQANQSSHPTGLGLLLIRRPMVTTSTFIARADPTVRGFSNSEIEAFLPLTVKGTLTHDPVNAALLSDGGPRGPKFARSSYATSLLSLAHTLSRSAGERRHRADTVQPDDGEDPDEAEKSA